MRLSEPSRQSFGSRLISRSALMLLWVSVFLHNMTPSIAQERADWIGKRVVQKYNNYPLRVNDRLVPRNLREMGIFRIRRIDGSRVWLEAEGTGPTGWAALDQFVPVDQGIDFFTKQIRVHPREAFPLDMRAWLWLDKKDFERTSWTPTKLCGSNRQT